MAGFYIPPPSLLHIEAVVSPALREVAEAFHFESLFQDGHELPLVLEVIGLVSAIERTADRPTLEAGVATHIHPAELPWHGGGGIDTEVFAHGIFRNDLFRGLDDEMEIGVLHIHDDIGGGLFGFNLFKPCLVGLVGGFPTRNVFAPLNFEARDAGGFPCDGLPMRAVVLVVPTLMVAIEMTHFVQEAVAVLVFRAVIEQGDGDFLTAPNAPTERTELTAGIVERDGNNGEFVGENDGVELLEPLVHLGDGRLHNRACYWFQLTICKSRAKP